MEHEDQLVAAEVDSPAPLARLHTELPGEARPAAVVIDVALPEKAGEVVENLPLFGVEEGAQVEVTEFLGHGEIWLVVEPAAPFSGRRCQEERCSRCDCLQRDRK